MSSERGKNGRGVLKKEQKTEGRLKEEDVRKTATRIGTVEQFLKQRVRKTEAPSIKKEGSIKKEREWADRGAKKEDENTERRKREERLRAIQEDPGEIEKSWLTKEMEKIKFDEGSEPTEEDIKHQIRLPNPAKIEEFKEPIKEWEVKNNLKRDRILSLICVQGC